MVVLFRIEYTKKKEKRAQIKVQKDETIPRDDQYKSHTVHVPSGEPPSSLSRPPAKRKPGVVRPITEGKLLRAGGPSKVKGTLYTLRRVYLIFALANSYFEASAQGPVITRKGCGPSASRPSRHEEACSSGTFVRICCASPTASASSKRSSSSS